LSVQKVLKMLPLVLRERVLDSRNLGDGRRSRRFRFRFCFWSGRHLGFGWFCYGGRFSLDGLCGR
jgi:hypothetical protein